MPSYYEAVGEEPTYALAEGIIKAFIRDLKNRRLSRVNIRKDMSSALKVINNHFPDVLIKIESSIYITDSTKHTLNANDLLIMDYYLLLLNEYEERVNKYQRYLKKQQDRQRNKLLFVLFLPFILFVLMILVGD